MHAAQQPQRQASRVPAPGAVWPSRCIGPFEEGRPAGYPPGGMPDPARSPTQGQVCPQPFVLVGLDAIGRAVGAGQGAVKRWIREDGFPARRCSDGTYRADPEAVRRWFWHGHGAGAKSGGKGTERSH